MRLSEGFRWGQLEFHSLCTCVCVCVCVLCVCVCVCVRVSGQQGRDRKFTVTNKYSDTLCNTNTPYCHGHGGINLLSTILPTVTMTTQQTAQCQVYIRQGYHRYSHISSIHTSFIILFDLSFRCLRKIAKSYKVRHVCLSVRTEQLGSN
jgi:hypothetical protein